MGPFGGAMVFPMLPELRDGLHTTLTVAASSLTAYMVPFAALMLVSGTLAERWGRRRTVRTAFFGYAAASALCALATGPLAFMAGRAGQGAANAFTTPVLVAAISDLVSPDRLGPALGRFGGFSAAGQAFAPLVGGLAAAVSWRLAFLASVVVALVLAAFPPPNARPGRGVARGERWRSLLNRRLALACAIAMLLYHTALGTTMLAALLAGDRFGLGPDARGLVIAVFGIAGLVSGARFGRGLDRLGTRRFGISALVAMGLAAVGVGLAARLPAFVVALAVGGAAGTAGRVTVNSLAVRSTPVNPGGATSMTLAWQFLGGAVAPALLLPVYRIDPRLSLLAAGSTALAAALLLAVVNSSLLPGRAGVPAARAPSREIRG